MPPLVLVGLVGPAIALHNSETLHRELGERFYVSPNLKALVEAGKRSYDDEGVAELLTAPESPVELTAQQVRERVIGMIVEDDISQATGNRFLFSLSVHVETVPRTGDRGPRENGFMSKIGSMGKAGWRWWGGWISVGSL